MKLKGLAILAAGVPHLSKNRYITYYLLLTFSGSPQLPEVGSLPIYQLSYTLVNLIDYVLMDAIQKIFNLKG